MTCSSLCVTKDDKVECEYSVHKLENGMLNFLVRDVSWREHVFQESVEKNKWYLWLGCKDHMPSCPHWRQSEASLVLLNIASNLYPSQFLIKIYQINCTWICIISTMFVCEDSLPRRLGCTKGATFLWQLDWDRWQSTVSQLNDSGGQMVQQFVQIYVKLVFMLSNCMLKSHCAW